MTRLLIGAAGVAAAALVLLAASLASDFADASASPSPPQGLCDLGRSAPRQGASGSVNLKTAPPLEAASAQILPPWALMMDLQT